jgi:hypothetical protein
MKLNRLTAALASLAALAVAAAVSGCDSAEVRIDEGRPLAELDMSGEAPNSLALYGPDEVDIRTGEKLTISVNGDKTAADDLRFSLKGGTLGVGRRNGSKASGTAVVHVTMPPPGKLVGAGSGKIRSEAVAKDVVVTLAGSGDIETMQVAANRLKVTIAGSGAYRAAGTATWLELNIVGSGDAAMDGLKSDNARIKIAGSGRSSFSSDGEVNASIVGSGEVTVRGRARCKVTAVGSGKLVCEAAEPA